LYLYSNSGAFQRITGFPSYVNACRIGRDHLQRRARGRQFTYALLDERVPRSLALKRDEALAELARRYFTSHGPATVQDFAWWSGLPVADARSGIGMLKHQMIHEDVDGQTYWFAASTPR